MTKSLVTIPVTDKQTCRNCKVTLDRYKLYRNIIDMTKDAYGIPTIIVRCPVCKALIEWETICN